MPKYPARTYEDISKKINFEDFRNKLKLKHIEVRENFSKQFPYVVQFLRDRGIDLGKIREHSSKILSAGVLTGSLVLSSPLNIRALPPVTEIIDKIRLGGGTLSISSLQALLLKSLSEILPDKPRPLTPDEEEHIEQIFSQIIKVPTKANLGGEHLNTSYGYIGAEQHLRRYPGDTLTAHGEGGVLDEGIAPGLGAWGYFAPTKEDLTPGLGETEKWYAVVQTLYLPDWSSRHQFLVKWYKYRKVLIVNTQNGNAVVASIADSGPAAWTGKHFGGSPEVMEYLGGNKYKKGPVLVFFVDDSENKIPLGPVDYNKLNLQEMDFEKT